MSVHYSEDFKKEVVRAYMTSNKSTIQIAVDYDIAKNNVSQWINQYREECFIPHVQHLNQMKLRK